MKYKQSLINQNRTSRHIPAFMLSLSHKKTIFEMPQQDYASPGPIYNTWGLGTYRKSASHQIGNSRRTQINHWVEKTPSPAQYHTLKHSKSQKITIPKGDLKESPNNNPPPGWYNAQKERVKPKSPTYSMGVKYGSIMDDVNDHPGPARYEIKREMTSLTKSKSERGELFSSAARFQTPNKHPGVGQYQIADKEGMIRNQGTIGNGERQPITKPNYPGPGDYKKESCFEQSLKNKMGKTFSVKLKGCFENKGLTTQAYNKYFADYMPQPTQFQTTKQFSIPKQKRQVFKTNSHPGPSDYNPHAFQPKDSKKVTIFKSTYQPFHEVIDNPGPGAYAIQVQRKPEYTIPRAKSATLVRDYPGVGRYDISKGMTERVGSAIPKSARTNFISKNIAGVGDYQIQATKKAWKCTIGKSQRFKKAQNLPGPGDYHIQSIMGLKSKHNK